jgi:hypothetical protein
MFGPGGHTDQAGATTQRGLALSITAPPVPRSPPTTSTWPKSPCGRRQPRRQAGQGQPIERLRGITGVFGLRHGVKGSDVWQNYTHLARIALPIHARLAS